MTEAPAKPCRRWSWGGVRCPSFRTAFLVCIAIPLAFVAWAFIDASFTDVLEVIAMQFESGQTDLDGIELRAFIGGADLGYRLLVLGILVAIAVASGFVVFYRLVLGTERERSLRGMLLTVALVGAWLTAILSYHSLVHAGFRWRVHRMVPAIKGDAEILMANWPTTNGELPFCGSYSASPNDDWITVGLLDQHCSMNEYVFGIWRAEDGGVRFDIRTVATKLEYHPGEGKPSSFLYSVRSGGKDHGTVKHVMQNYIELEPNWFLVWYSISDL